MALALNTLTSGTTTGGATVASVVTASFTPTADARLYIWLFTQNDNNGSERAYSCAGGGLTWTKLADPPTRTWGGLYTEFRATGVLYEAIVGGSPSSMTITIDPDTTGTNTFYSSWVVFEVTGGATHVQSVVTASEIDGGGDSETLSVSLGSAATSGNLVVACFGASGDGAGAVTAPSGFTSVVAQTQTATHIALFSSTTFTGTAVATTDLGQLVGNSAVAVIELAGPGGGGAVTGTGVGSLGVNGVAAGTSGALIIFGAIGTKAGTGTTTVSVAHPAGTAANQVLLAGRCAWESGATFSNETGWTSSGSLQGGTGTATDAHVTVIRVDRKELSGSDAGPTVFDQAVAGQGGVCAVMASYTKASSTATWGFATATGDDATHGANRSVTSSSTIGLSVGDFITAWVAVDTDTDMSPTSPTFTATNVTFGTVTRRTSGVGSGTGDDGNIELFDAAVTALSSGDEQTQAVTLAFTTATTQCGPVAFVRLRSVPHNENGVAAGSLTITGTAAGTVTSAGAVTGTAAGSLTMSGTAAGVRDVTGAAVGALTVTGVAVVAGEGALSYTDRGEFQTGQGGITMVATSSSITPAAGSLLVVGLAVAAGQGGTDPGVVSLSDTIGGTGGGTWTRRASTARTTLPTSEYLERAEIWSRLIGTSPGAGTVTVTVTVNAGTSTFDGWVWCNAVEFTGQHSTPTGATSGIDTAFQDAGSTTLNLTLSANPAASSIVYAVLHQDNATAHATLTGYTTLQSEAPAWGATSAAYVSTIDEDTTVAWTGATSAARLLGAAVEIVSAAGAGADVTGTAVGTLTVVGTASTPTGRFPAGISADDHHIVDAYGDPWFMMGDSGWEIGVQLGPADVEQYLEDRAAKGFNAILCQLTEIGAFTTNGPNNYNNDPPFTGAAYASSMNEAYWAHWDDIFAVGAALGITFVCCPAYQGIGGPSGGEGWYNTIAAVSNTNMQNFGTALGTRYADTPNIIWVAGGDNALDGTMDARWGAFFTGLAATGDTHLRTFHSEPGQSGQATAGGETWFDLNNVYEYGIADTAITDESNSAWTGSPTRPAFYLEGRYEYENSATRADLRRQIYTSVFGGCFSGFVWGNAPIWYFNGFGGFFAPPSAYDTWQEALNSPSTADVVVSIDFFTGLGENLHTFGPDPTNTFLTAGEGQGAAAFNTTATTGVVGLAYRENGGSSSVTLDLTEVDQVATVSVSKVDPTTGGATVLGTHATSGSQSFGSLGTNTAGDTDWVLIVTVYNPVAVAGTAAGSVAIGGTASGVRAVSGAAAGSLVLVGTYVDFTFVGRRPAEISGRKVLDQLGDVHLMRTLASWGMANNLSRTEITAALEAVAAAGFNGVTVWVGGSVDLGTGWHRYTDAAGHNFWTGTPWASPLGAAWTTVDHLIAEAGRLGITVHASLCGGNALTGCRVDWFAAGDAAMYAAGAAIAGRYLNADNIVWHVYFDDDDAPDDASGHRVQAFFDGVNDTEGISTRPIRWSQSAAGDDALDAGWLGVGAFNVTLNTVYDHAMTSTVIAETVYGAIPVPVGDANPPADGSGVFTGDMDQQLRERSYSVFLEGGVLINYGHADWYRFGAAGPATEGLDWDDVPTHSHTVQQSYCWTLLDRYVADATWAPSGWVSTGEGSGDTKAAAGNSNTAALAYFPNSRTIAVDTTVIAGLASVHLRWFDPTNNSFTDIAIGEIQQTGRSVTHPGNNSAGQGDWVLVVTVASLGNAAGSLVFGAAAAGTVAVSGTGAGSLTLNGVVTGVIAESGVAAGSLSFTATSSGVRNTAGAGVGSLAVAGVAAGVRVMSGTAAGSLAVAGAAAGVPEHTASAVGSLAVAGVAAGIPDVTATAVGSLAFAATAIGQVAGAGAGFGVGSLAVTGAATGVRDTAGTVVGSLAIVGVAAGTSSSPGGGTAVGTLAFAAAASGIPDVSGAAVGALAFAATAAGVRDTTGSAAGSLAFTATAIGLSAGEAAGLGFGHLTLEGEASGSRGIEGQASGMVALDATASGEGLASGIGIAVGTIVLAGTASGVRGVTGSGLGVFSIIGRIGAEGVGLSADVVFVVRERPRYFIVRE